MGEVVKLSRYQRPPSPEPCRCVVYCSKKRETPGCQGPCEPTAFVKTEEVKHG